MNYRHGYHAGNFADVFKHVILLLLLQKMRQKEAPFCVLDTHAGRGIYDLAAEAALKTGEATAGVERVLAASSLEHPIWQLYKECIAAVNEEGAVTSYPGSPYISGMLLREQDRLVLSELHPEEAALLKEEFRTDDNIAVHHTDGYLAIKAFLPPKEKRGLVLIDPPFEKTDEFRAMAEAAALAHTRFRQAVTALWYPIKDQETVQQFYNGLYNLPMPEILVAEIAVKPLNREGLPACGMAIINPPWQVKEALEEVLPEMLAVLRQERGGFCTVRWLKN